MKTGFRGTFVMSWSQTEVEGQATPIEALGVGMAWAWTGEAVRVDGPNDVLRLDRSDDQAALRQRAARKVRRMVGQVLGDALRATMGEANALLSPPNPAENAA